MRQSAKNRFENRKAIKAAKEQGFQMNPKWLQASKSMEIFIHPACFKDPAAAPKHDANADGYE